MKKCKECGEEKESSMFYRHPYTKDKLISRCKECIKKGRASEHERKMARIVDNKRSKLRIEYATENTRRFRKENPEKYKAHLLVNNFLKKNTEFRVSECRLCGSVGRIHYHHFDYTKPNEVIPCCPLCHKKLHKGIEFSQSMIEIFKF